MNHIVLIGIQGSGKGTQARKLVEKYGYVIFETGAELRKFSQGNHPQAGEVKMILESGNLVPLWLIKEILADFIKNLPANTKVIFDGIPRNAEQKQVFEEVVADFGVLYFQLDRHDAMARLLGRRIDPTTNETFGADFELDYNPKTGEKLVVRSDDTEQAILRRIEVFYDVTLPLVETWKQEERKVYDIDADLSVDEVFEEVEKVLHLG